MNTAAVNTAAGVILAALTQNRTAAGIALALDSARLLNSPEVAAEFEALQQSVASVRAVADAINAEMRTEPDTQRAAMQTEAVTRIRAALDGHPLRADGPTGRIAQLLDAIRTHRGEWTTRRVQQLYRSPGINAPQRGTARRDLHALYAMGHLIEHDLKGRRHYTLATRIREA